MPNVYHNLQTARIQLQDMKLKKSGEVKFKQVDFTYYELADFLPAVNELCKKNGLVTNFSINKNEYGEYALLSIINIEKPSEVIKFKAPTAESTSLGDALKNLGGKITYMRRYMLMTAFEMVESDTVEAIKRELASEIRDEEVKKISEAKDFEDLTNICGKLKTKYKVELIKPYYDKRKEELDDKVIKKV